MYRGSIGRDFQKGNRLVTFVFQKERKNVLLILGIMEEKEERYPYHQDETCNWFNYFSKR